MKRPCDWIQPWPDGQPLPEAPRAASWLAALARMLSDYDSVVLANATGLPVAAVEDVLLGRAWPDLHVTAAIIDGIGEAERCAQASKLGREPSPSAEVLRASTLLRWTQSLRTRRPRALRKGTGE